MARVLIVDDELISTEVLGEVFADAGHDVKTASNGSEAIKVGEDFFPDIIISDWKLKDEIDGCQLARILQNQNQNLKVILFSGSSSVDLAREAHDIKVHSILEKPCDIDEVLNKATEALSEASGS